MKFPGKRRHGVLLARILPAGNALSDNVSQRSQRVKSTDQTKRNQPLRINCLLTLPLDKSGSYLSREENMSKFKLRLFLFVAVIFAVTTTAWGTGSQEKTTSIPEPADSTLLPTDPALTVRRLQNGMTYIIRENPQPEKRAFLRLVVNAGSVLERDDQRGLAHFVEHMAFNGTTDFPGNKVVSYMESLGMRFGPDVNAYTSFDETVYRLEVPTDNPEQLSGGFHVLQQWADAISFKPEEIDKERGVILEERRLGRGAQARMRDKQFPVLFNGSRYAERLPIGLPEVVKNFKYNTLTSFYRKWYRPDLMAVIAVGDFKTADIEKLIRHYFADIPARPEAEPRPIYDVPPNKGTLYAIASDKEAAYTTVSVYNKREPRPFNTYEDYRTSLMHNLFAIMLNARFDELTKKPDAPFINAGAGHTGLVRTLEVNYLSAIVQGDQVKKGLAALVREALRVKRYGFTQSEFERAKKELLRSYESAYQERNKSESSSFVSEYTRYYLQGEASPGISLEYQVAQKYVPGITLDQVNGLADAYLADSNRVIVVGAVANEKNPPPSQEELSATLQATLSGRVEPYVDETATTPLLEEAPKPGRVVSEKKYEKSGVTEWKLSNGVRVVLKPTDFKNDEVRFDSFSSGGTSLASDKDYLSAAYAASIVRRSGVGNFTQTQLEKYLSGKDVTVTPFIDELYQGVMGSASVQDLKTMFQLIYLYITQPRKDQSAFEAAKQRLETLVQNRNQQPDVQFGNKLQKILSSDHPRRQPLTLQRVGEIDLDSAYSIYRDRFSHAADSTFVFVGNIDPATLKPLVATYLGGLPASPGTMEWKNIGITRPGGVVKESVDAGIESKSTVAIVYHAPYQWSVENNYVLNSLSQVLEIRLREILREKEGGTYSVGLWPSTSRFPDQEYLFYITFGTAPDRAEPLANEARTVVKEMQENGTSADYIQRVTSTQLAEYQTNLRDNSFWLHQLYSDYFHGLSPDTILDYPDMVKNLTPEKIQKAAGRYLDNSRYVQLILYPKEGDGSQQTLSH